MSLSKSDLLQIGNVVDEKLDKQNGLITERFDDVEKRLKTINKDLRYVKKTVSVLVERSDREETLLKRRVVRIEKHLILPQN